MFMSMELVLRFMVMCRVRVPRAFVVEDSAAEPDYQVEVVDKAVDHFLQSQCQISDHA